MGPSYVDSLPSIHPIRPGPASWYRFDPATDDLSQLRKLMAFSRRFVQCLRLQQLPSHLDLQLLFDTMQLTPTQLAISYNPRGLGMNYSTSAAGMRLSDCRMLARALAHTGEPAQSS